MPNTDIIPKYFRLQTRWWTRRGNGRIYECCACNHRVSGKDGDDIREGVEAHREESPGCFEGSDHG